MHHTEDGRSLAWLINERLGGRRYGVFFATGEGSFFPNGVEESSGCVVDEDGRHYAYWTGWDGAAGRARFDQWELIADGGWDDEEYRDARRDAGLRSSGA